MNAERLPLLLLSVPLPTGGTEPLYALIDPENLVIRLSAEAGPVDHPLISWDDEAIARVQATLAGPRVRFGESALLVVADSDPALIGLAPFGDLMREVAEAAVRLRHAARRREKLDQVLPDADPFETFEAAGERVHLLRSIAQEARCLAAAGRTREAVRLVREHVPRLALAVAKALVDQWSGGRPRNLGR